MGLEQSSKGSKVEKAIFSEERNLPLQEVSVVNEAEVKSVGSSEAEPDRERRFSCSKNVSAM